MLFQKNKQENKRDRDGEEQAELERDPGRFGRCLTQHHQRLLARVHTRGLLHFTLVGARVCGLQVRDGDRGVAIGWIRGAEVHQLHPTGGPVCEHLPARERQDLWG